MAIAYAKRCPSKFRTNAGGQVSITWVARATGVRAIQPAGTPGTGDDRPAAA